MASIEIRATNVTRPPAYLVGDCPTLCLLYFIVYEIKLITSKKSPITVGPPTSLSIIKKLSSSLLNFAA